MADEEVVTELGIIVQQDDCERWIEAAQEGGVRIPSVK
jgi:hypothetical protein